MIEGGMRNDYEMRLQRYGMAQDPARAEKKEQKGGLKTVHSSFVKFREKAQVGQDISLVARMRKCVRRLVFYDFRRLDVGFDEEAPDRRLSDAENSPLCAGDHLRRRNDSCVVAHHCSRR